MLIGLLPPVGSPAVHQNAPPIPLVIADQPPVPDDLLQFGNAESRMTVPVSIDGRGPYEFIVDTGAQRTVVSRDLAGLLGLRPGRRVNVTAMTSSAVVGTVIVPSLRVSRIAAETIEAPALEQSNMGAPGMLGIDALQGHAVSIDFARNEMTVQPSRRHRREPAKPDEIVVVAKSRYGQLIVTNAQYRGRSIAVVIDTGSPVSIGNFALRRELGDDTKRIGTVSLVSALGGLLVADYVQIDRLKLGDVGFDHMPIAFVDAEPFKRFDLTKEPAILLGMDALRLFRGVRIDFTNRQIRFLLPDTSAAGGG